MKDAVFLNEQIDLLKAISSYLYVYDNTYALLCRHAISECHGRVIRLPKHKKEPATDWISIAERLRDKWNFRLLNIRKAQLVIIDEIGYTPISRTQANRFFTFISDTYETNSIIFTTNKKITDWAEMMGDPVLTTAMLDRILHHARCFSLQGQSYRLKHPKLFSSL